LYITSLPTYKRQVKLHYKFKNKLKN